VQRAPAGLRTPGQLPQQRALADPAGSVQVHDVGGRVVLQQRLEQLQLVRASHEARCVALGDPRTQGGAHVADRTGPGETDVRVL
jgi:hypothetical protein